jgi:hypothetical protein
LNLKTGITAKQPHWEVLLQQIGVPYYLIDPRNKITIDNYAVVIINSPLERETKNEIINYVNKGGSLLIEAKYANDLFGYKTKTIYIKYINSEAGIFKRNIQLTDIYKNCRISGEANYFKNQDGENTIQVTRIGEGTIVVLPTGFTASILENSTLRKNFYSGFGKFVSERVSKVSKGSIRYFLQAMIEYLYHVRGLPFASLWFYPDGAKNVFGFRIDTDFALPDDVDNLYKTIRQNNITATWFVETKSSEKWIEKYSSFKEQEIGLHCYRHKVFSSYRKNFLNLQLGLKTLEKAGIKPVGFAAPFGEWNKQLAQAIENTGFKYSSEFSVSYDNFPFNTFFNHSLLTVLQIPIHPISFGRLYWAGHSDSDMLNYFYRVIEQKLSLNEPVILYTHPEEKRYDILDKIFNKINQMNIPPILFNQYSEWWTKRNLIKWEAVLVSGEVKIKTPNKDKSFWVYVSNPSDENYINPLLEECYDSRVLKFKEFNYDKEINPVELRKYSWRMFKDDILFHYRKSKQ